MFQVPFQQRCGQQDLRLVTFFLTSNITATGLWHKVVFPPSIGFHEVSKIVTADISVLKDGAHLTKYLFEMVRYTNISFHAPKQMLISHLAQYSPWAHNFRFVDGSLLLQWR